MDDTVKLILSGMDDSLKNDIVNMVVDMVNIPSPTGHEKEMSQYVARRFREIGLSVDMQEVESERFNVIATLKGRGGGNTLMFNGHLDTSMTGEEEEQPPGQKPKAWIEDGWIYGLGSCNMKNAFAAYWGAIRLLQKARIMLKGDILVTAVVGEIEKSPIDQYVGKEFRGGGWGSIALMHRGVTADACICGECTGLRLQTGNTGYIFAKLTTTGVAQHTWAKEKGVDAIEKMLIVIEELKKWEVDFRRRHSHPKMETRLGIGAVQGGYPYKPSICPPPYCHLYIDIRTLPGQTAVSVKHEVEDLIESVRRKHPDIRVGVKFYMVRDGYEIDPDHKLVDVIKRAHQLVFSQPAKLPTPNRYCVSADTTIFGHYGIPSVTYGAGGVIKDGTYAMYDLQGECVGIDNLINLTQVYALAALDFCSTER